MSSSFASLSLYCDILVNHACPSGTKALDGAFQAEVCNVVDKIHSFARCQSDLPRRLAFGDTSRGKGHAWSNVAAVLLTVAGGHDDCHIILCDEVARCLLQRLAPLPHQHAKFTAALTLQSCKGHFVVHSKSSLNHRDGHVMDTSHGGKPTHTLSCVFAATLGAAPLAAAGQPLHNAAGGIRSYVQFMPFQQLL